MKQFCKNCCKNSKPMKGISKDLTKLKTSKEWLADIPEAERPKILDPDGWDRTNYDYSFNEELITKAEFNIRVMSSTIQMSATWNSQ